MNVSEDSEIELKPATKRGRPKKNEVVKEIVEPSPADETINASVTPTPTKPKRERSEKQIENFKKMLEAKKLNILKREQLKAAAEVKTQEILKKKEEKLTAKQRKESKLLVKQQKLKDLELMALSDSDDEEIVVKKKKKKVVYVDSDGEEDNSPNIVIINKLEKKETPASLSKEAILPKRRYVFL